MRKEDIRRGRKLSLLLRHQPELLGLTMDGDGWVDLDELLKSWSAASWRPVLSLDDLSRLVHENDKQRYTLDLPNHRMRARQGHSLDVDLNLEPVTPPETLYHGTVAQFLDAIKVKGLQKINRQHVHLSQSYGGAVGD